LFLQRGYAEVTVPEIAQAARVATQTVYSSTGGKAAILAELLQPAMDDPLAGEVGATIRRTGNPREVLAVAAAGTRRAHEQYWDILYHLVRLAPGDTAAQQAIDAAVAKCLDGLTGIAGRLHEMGALKEGVDCDQAVDTLWFYFGQNAWFSLVGDRGWTFDRAEAWLLDAASRDLLLPQRPFGSSGVRSAGDRGARGGAPGRA
jgi:AcrR family transcriptional regulator